MGQKRYAENVGQESKQNSIDGRRENTTKEYKREKKEILVKEMAAPLSFIDTVAATFQDATSPK